MNECSTRGIWIVKAWPCLGAQSSRARFGLVGVLTGTPTLGLGTRRQEADRPSPRPSCCSGPIARLLQTDLCSAREGLGGPRANRGAQPHKPRLPETARFADLREKSSETSHRTKLIVATTVGRPGPGPASGLELRPRGIRECRHPRRRAMLPTSAIRGDSSWSCTSSG
jgi:hypothetical protein